jgi:hypothetical protein
VSPDRISELVWDSESDEAEAMSDSVSEDEGGFQGQPALSHLQPDSRRSNGQASSISIFSSASDGFWSGSGQQVQIGPFAVHTTLCPSRVVHIFTGVTGRKETLKRHV